MASTAQPKSQALHNFPLPPLKWKHNHPHPRPRSSATSPSRSQSPMPEPLGKDVVDFKNYDLDLLPNGVYGSDQFVEKSEKNLKLGDFTSMGGEGKESRGKMLIRIPGGVQKNGGNEGGVEVEEVSADGQKGEDDEPLGKIWNLRPRKAIKMKKSSNVNGGGGGGGGGGVGLKSGVCGGSVEGENGVLQKGSVENLGRSKVGSDVNGLQKKEKRVKFSVALTRQEIEEDVFSFTGSKPTRRPKKRAKVVQKQLDNLFPGLWLASITPDSYKVSENYMNV